MGNGDNILNIFFVGLVELYALKHSIFEMMVEMGGWGSGLYTLNIKFFIIHDVVPAARIPNWFYFDFGFSFMFLVIGFVFGTWKKKEIFHLKFMRLIQWYNGKYNSIKIIDEFRVCTQT